MCLSCVRDICNVNKICLDLGLDAVLGNLKPTHFQTLHFTEVLWLLLTSDVENIEFYIHTNQYVTYREIKNFPKVRFGGIYGWFRSMK